MIAPSEYYLFKASIVGSLSSTRLGLKTELLLRHFSQDDTRINSAETKRVAHYIFQLGFASVIGHHIEITCRILISIVDCGRDPMPIQSERAKRRLDRTGRAERMRVVTFSSTDRDSPRMLAEHVFDRRRFGTVVELGGTGVRVDVIDLLRR